VDLPPEIRLTTLPDNKSVETMVADGELDACIHSSIIKPFIDGDPRVGRLFPDYKNEEIAFFRKTGMFPIMHITGIKKSIVEKYPWVPINMYHALNQAKAIAMKKMVNPRIVPLAWYREAWEEQEAILGKDPWEYGLTDRNRKTLANMAMYSHEQGLIKNRLTVDDLFLDVSQGRKRGEEFRV
jgi:4,5-dihydroxyphthalate decarboxylase